ncbi:MULTISPECIES: TetR/AcrR family transcriptional regulator [unclassified Pseudonocardia]|uniref:TetR/AcrR family transcriptional regulator n=1 Tax=unclassified Pseudonocardia TaxID=2619320 RepID=UPI000960CFC8|nr:MULTISPECIES: TetR/AcrR family transcriptional regulator [unclassified Pseudonocardia]MBN9102812.1 TetR/AcrR family transcriptional regulator [Pseudonocardia sp.]OJY47135.1 MAG: TetR family transcriptional regulator [Pseudonocardia sp. 73-21]
MSTPDPRPLGRREERTATSRARILDAAVACLVESGYAGATTLRIQARAGVSRGRLLHHFPSRDELLVAASRHLATERLRDTGMRVDDLGDHLTPAERLDRAVELMWETFSEPHFWAAVELWTAARTNHELRDAVLPEEREILAAVRAGMARFYGPELVSHPRYLHVRDLLFTSMRGVGLTYALEHRDPRTDPHLPMWKDVARELLT